MKILLTLDFPPEKGGIQRYLYEIVKHTYTKDDIVLTIGRTTEEDSLLPCFVRRIPLFFSKKISLIPLFFVFLGYFLKNRNNITVFCGNVYPAIIISIMSMIFRIPYYIYCYGTELIGIRKNILFYYLSRNIIFKRSVALYYLSNTTKRLIESINSKCKCLEELPKIDPPEYKVEKKNYNKGIINILSVGRLVPHKGHSVLIKAVSLLKVDIEWRLKIVGDGPLYKKLLNEIEDISLSKRVTIEKNVSDSQLKDYYIESDIFVLPSIETNNGIEGFGIVLLEAMAYGVAIVASRSGGIEEVFCGCPQAALLVQCGNPYELCRAINQLIKNPEQRQEMALKAREYLESRYVWK